MALILAVLVLQMDATLPDNSPVPYSQSVLDVSEDDFDDEVVPSSAPSTPVSQSSSAQCPPRSRFSTAPPLRADVVGGVKQPAPVRTLSGLPAFAAAADEPALLLPLRNGGVFRSALAPIVPNGSVDDGRTVLSFLRSINAHSSPLLSASSASLVSAAAASAVAKRKSSAPQRADTAKKPKRVNSKAASQAKVTPPAYEFLEWTDDTDELPAEHAVDSDGLIILSSDDDDVAIVPPPRASRPPRAPSTTPIELDVRAFSRVFSRLYASERAIVFRYLNASFRARFTTAHPDLVRGF